MTRLTILALLGVLTLGAYGCDRSAEAGESKSSKSSKGDKAGKGDDKGDDKAEAKETKNTKGESSLKLGKLDNLKITAPDAEVSDGLMGKGVSLSSPDIGVLSIEEETASDPKTLDAAKEEYSLINTKNTKTEKLSDGWTMVFENTGSMGTNYWVAARREIGGKAYKCTSTLTTKAQQTAAVAACKSLKK
jgi:hypothetical protein